MRIQPGYPPITCIYSIASRYHYLGATGGPNYIHTSTNRHKPKYNKIHLTVAYRGHCFIKMYFPFRLELKPSKPIHPLCQTHPRTILLTMHFYNVFMSYFDLNQWSKTFETIRQSHQDTVRLGPGPTHCMCATCNATLTALTVLLCLHSHNFMQTTPMGEGMCGPKLGYSSAVHVATHLVPHSPDLIPTGCYMYYEGGVPSSTQA